MVRWILGGLIVVGLLIVGGVAVFGAASHHPRPETGQVGAAAEQMAERMRDAVRMDAWAETGAVRWTFGGRHQHLWDRERGLSRVAWGDVVVLQETGRSGHGRAWRDGVEVTGEDRQGLLETAYGAFINDAFWLNPWENLYDDGVTLSAVDFDGQPGLLVEYATGGTTPGDAYLWLLGEGGLPEAWRMWVSVLPVGGVRSTWEGWQALSTGALVSTTHATGPSSLQLITEARGARRLAELEPGADPFAPLAADAEGAASAAR